jgi:hypothetical protein
MATRSSSKKSAKPAGKRGIKNLPTKTLKAGQAKRVKGGASVYDKHKDEIEV